MDLQFWLVLQLVLHGDVEVQFQQAVRPRVGHVRQRPPTLSILSPDRLGGGTGCFTAPRLTLVMKTSTPDP